MEDRNKLKQLNFVIMPRMGRAFYNFVVSPYLIGAIAFLVVAVVAANGFFAFRYYKLKDQVRVEKADIELSAEVTRLRQEADAIRKELEELKRTRDRIEEKTGISTDPPGSVDYLSVSQREVGMPTRKMAPAEVVSIREELRILGEEIHARRETLEFTEKKVEKLVDKFSSIPSISPVRNPRVTSGFGYRIHPISGRREFHKGIDLKGNYTTPIYATADGEVSFCGWMRGYGRMLKIEHQNGFLTVYAHNSRNLVKKGETVKKGQIIAYVGATGTTTGSHVHYEVRYNNRLLNPRKFLSLELKDIDRF